MRILYVLVENYYVFEYNINIVINLYEIYRCVKYLIEKNINNISNVKKKAVLYKTTYRD